MIEVLETKFPEVYRIMIKDRFEDYRGRYVEIWNEELYRVLGDIRWRQDDISVSYRGVLRGIHGDYITWKLISCLYGRFYLVVVDCRKDSDTYGQWEGFTLSDRNCEQVLVPPGFGNGHLVLSRMAIFHYKQSTLYDPTVQFTLAWDDPQLGIRWPVMHPLTSERDMGCKEGE